MIFSFVVKATSMSDLDFSVTLVGVFTSCDRPKVEQKSLKAQPSGSLPSTLQLSLQVLSRLNHAARNLQMPRSSSLEINRSVRLSISCKEKKQIKFLTLYFQP